MTSASCAAATVLLLTLLAGCGLTAGQSVVAPFNGSYTLSTVHVPDRIRLGVGGLQFLHDNKLLVVSDFNHVQAMLKQLPMQRHPTTQRIVGFGVPTLYSRARYTLSGLGFFPDGDVLFFTQPDFNALQQRRLGHDHGLNTSLTPLGIGHCHRSDHCAQRPALAPAV